LIFVYVTLRCRAVILLFVVGCLVVTLLVTFTFGCWLVCCTFTFGFVVVVARLRLRLRLLYARCVYTLIYVLFDLYVVVVIRLRLRYTRYVRSRTLLPHTLRWIVLFCYLRLLRLRRLPVVAGCCPVATLLVGPVVARLICCCCYVRLLHVTLHVTFTVVDLLLIYVVV